MECYEFNHYALELLQSINDLLVILCVFTGVLILLTVITFLFRKLGG